MTLPGICRVCDREEEKGQNGERTGSLQCTRVSTDILDVSASLSAGPEIKQ